MDARQVGDELEIAGLLTKYAHAVDSKDWELYRSVFTDDAFIDYSASGVILGSLDEVTDFFRGDFSALVSMSVHYISTSRPRPTATPHGCARCSATPRRSGGWRSCATSAVTTATNTGPHTGRLAQHDSPRVSGVDGQPPAERVGGHGRRGAGRDHSTGR
jgi:hypothetical protein